VTGSGACGYESRCYIKGRDFNKYLELIASNNFETCSGHNLQIGYTIISCNEVVR
jgi:hypothetical protein